MSNKAFSFIYLLLLCSTAGGILALGAFAAPMIFHHEAVLGVALLDRYNAGLIMSRIFVNFNYMLSLAIVFATAFNGYHFFKDENKPKASAILSIAALVAGALFIFYLTPKILLLQQLGPSSILNSEFEAIHKASELDFKLLFVLFIVMAYLHFSKIFSKTQDDRDNRAL